MILLYYTCVCMCLYVSITTYCVYKQMISLSLSLSLSLSYTHTHTPPPETHNRTMPLVSPSTLLVQSSVVYLYWRVQLASLVQYNNNNCSCSLVQCPCTGEFSQLVQQFSTMPVVQCSEFSQLVQFSSGEFSQLVQQWRVQSTSLVLQYHASSLVQCTCT